MHSIDERHANPKVCLLAVLDVRREVAMVVARVLIPPDERIVGDRCKEHRAFLGLDDAFHFAGVLTFISEAFQRSRPDRCFDERDAVACRVKMKEDDASGVLREDALRRCEEAEQKSDQQYRAHRSSERGRDGCGGE